MFSRACKYAIKTMIYIAANEERGRKTGLREVTQAINSPEAFTAKIMQQLVKAGMLESYKGPNGGFIIPENKKVLLFDIVQTIDGEDLLKNCVLGLSECNEVNPCPVHSRFIEIRNDLKSALIQTEVRDKDLASHM